MEQIQKVNILLIIDPTSNDSSQLDKTVKLLKAEDNYILHANFEEIGKQPEVAYQAVVVDDISLNKKENLELIDKIKIQSPYLETIVLANTTEYYLTAFQTGTFHILKYDELENIVSMMNDVVQQHHSNRTKHANKLKMLLSNKLELSALFSRPDDDDETFDFHLKKILTHTCQLVVELLRVNHSGFILFDSDNITGKLLAEYPPMGMIGLQIPIKGIPAEENLIQCKGSLIIQDVANEESLGQVRDTLNQWGIHSILITPVVSKDKVLGSFSLDAFGNTRCFTDEEVELCKSLAAQVAVAIENLQTIEEYKKRQKLLKALIETSQHIQAAQTESTLFQSIVRLATELVDYEVGGLCINRPHLRELEIVETHGFPKKFDDSPKPLVSKVLPHSKGLIGLVARTGKIGEVINYDSWLGRDPIFEPYNFKTHICVPIKNAGGVEAVLFVADTRDKQNSVREDLDILQRYTSQVSIALQTSKLINQEQRVFSQLATLHRISDYVQAADDLDKILHVTLTGVTAIFGLRFNRAVLFFLEERNKNKYLVGQKGIGQMNDPQAREAWKRDREVGLYDIARYFDYLEKGLIAPTQIDEKAIKLRLLLTENSLDVFSQAIENKECIIVNDRKEILPEEFIKQIEPSIPFAVAPLIARGRVFGLVYVDNKITNAPITKELADLFMMFVNTAAIAIHNTQTFQEAHRAKERRQLLLQASNNLVSSQQPEEVLKDSLDKVLKVSQATWARVVLVNQIGSALIQTLILVGNPKKKIDVAQEIREDGITMRVIASGEPFFVEDINGVQDGITPNRILIEEGCEAAICLPLSLHGERIGVVWIHYDKPQRFLGSSIIYDLQLYTNQVAIAYDNAQRIENLENKRKAAENLSKVTKTKETLEQIVKSAKEVLKADWTAVWYYDESQKKFILENSVAYGIDQAEWKEFLNEVPSQGGTAYTTLDRGLIAVQDIRNESNYRDLLFNFEPTRELLMKMGVRSFQGIALSAGTDKLGVLYVNYKNPYKFGDEQDKSANYFASRAALALQRAKLFEQHERIHSTAMGIAELSNLRNIKNVPDKNLGDLIDYLRSVLEKTQEATHCDVVTLYTYNQENNRFRHPPVMKGVWYENLASSQEEVSRSSLVFEILNKVAPYIADDAPSDKLFKESRFAKDEQIKSCVGIPLRVDGARVGVMFVSYRQRHQTTNDEALNIELLAHLAAIAIHNAQLFEERVKRLYVHQELSKLSQRLIVMNNLQELLDEAVVISKDVLEVDCCSIILKNSNEELIFGASIGLGIPNETKLKEGNKTQTGYTLSSQEPIKVDDYFTEKRFNVHPIVEEHRLKSGMSVRINTNNSVIGVMLVHTKKLRSFSREDENLLLLIASQIAIAYESVHRFEEIRSLCEASKAITEGVSLARKQILDLILEQAMNFAGRHGPKPISGTIQLWNESKQRLRFESVFPKDTLPDLVQRIGEEREVSEQLKGQNKIGITGRVVLSKKPELIPNIRGDKDYIIFNEKTLSSLTLPLTLPLNNDKKVIGVLNVESDQLKGFDENDLRTLEALADLAAIAIKNVEYYQELKDASQRKTDFLNNVVHEFQTPISIAKTFIDNLRVGVYGNLNDKQVQITGKIYNHITNLAQLTTNILNLSRFEQGRITLDKKLSSLSKTIQNVIEKLEDFAKWKGIKLISGLPNEDQLELEMDVEKIDCVITNLIHNAIKFTEKEGVITITASRSSSDNKFLVEVKDTGIGISEEDLNKVFERFYQVKTSHTANGTGIGLDVAKTFVEMHQGQIKVKSKIGEGSTFSFELHY